MTKEGKVDIKMFQAPKTTEHFQKRKNKLALEVKRARKQKATITAKKEKEKKEVFLYMDVVLWARSDIYHHPQTPTVQNVR